MTGTAPIGSVLGGLATVMTQGKSMNGVSTNNFAHTLQATQQQQNQSWGDPVIDKFMKYQQMSPAEKIRASYLASHGLTEDDLKAMGPDERQKIEAQIKEEIRKRLLSGNEGSAAKTSAG
jgi:hypothetical protein